MSVSIDSMNYSMLDEIWDNYKYPKNNKPKPNYTSSQTHNMGPSLSGDNNTNNNNQQQPPASIHVEEFKPIHGPGPAPGKHQGDVSDTFNQSQDRYVQEHPSNSNHSTTDTYNQIPYSKNEVYSPVHTYMSNGTHTNQTCTEQIKHVKGCRYCFEHMKRELNLSTPKEKTLLDFLPKIDTNTAILIMGGIAAGFILSDLFKRGGKRYRL